MDYYLLEPSDINLLYSDSDMADMDAVASDVVSGCLGMPGYVVALQPGSGILRGRKTPGALSLKQLARKDFPSYMKLVDYLRVMGEV